MSVQIDSWDDATTVFAFGPGSFMVVAGVIVGLSLLVWFFVTMIRHENHAYAQMLAHEPVEAGPAVEGEPPAY